MRPQTVGLIVASCVTGIFVAAVTGVLVYQNLPDRGQQGQPAPGGNKMFAFNFNAQKVEVGQDIAIEENVVPFQGFEPGVNPGELPRVDGKPVALKEYKISEPQTHGNLTVFFIHGPDAVKDMKVLMLQEALDQNLAVVHDRGVLSIDNRSNMPIFIQSGDIVKGGNQDRTLPYDTLVPPLARNAPLDALCVESGRSFARAGEPSSYFQTSAEQLPTRTLKLAALRKDQSGVWNNVAATQNKLTRVVGAKVNGVQSHTSLQLTLEHPRVQEATQEYINGLAPALAGKEDVVGYVVAVNGKVQSADVYGSANIFQKLWPKLIRAGAVEALAERQQGAAFTPPNAETVQAFLNDAERGQRTSVNNRNGSSVFCQQGTQTILHDTCLPRQQDVVLHRSFLAK
jgi:hypothetical protein